MRKALVSRFQITDSRQCTAETEWNASGMQRDVMKLALGDRATKVNVGTMRLTRCQH